VIVRLGVTLAILVASWLRLDGAGSACVRGSARRSSVVP
jgi:hypothetical protein